MKCTAWPIIQHGDVWADKYTSLRYYIDKIQVASKFKHVPLIYITDAFDIAVGYNVY